MKIIKIESCYDCNAFVQDTSTRGTDHYCAKTGDIFVDSDPKTSPLWCPLEDAPDKEECNHEWEPCNAVQCENCGLIVED